MDEKIAGGEGLRSPKVSLTSELLQCTGFLFSPLVGTGHGNGNGQVSVDSPCAAARAGTF